MQEDNDQEKPTADDAGSIVDEWDKTGDIDPLATTELELVSTQQLHTILASGDEESRQSIEDAAASDKDGVLVRDLATGGYAIVEESDIPGSPGDVPTDDSASGEELSLVSSQVLRQLMGGETELETGPESAAEVGKPAKSDDAGGFDPYNSS